MHHGEPNEHRKLQHESTAQVNKMMQPVFLTSIHQRRFKHEMLEKIITFNVPSSVSLPINYNVVGK